MQESTVRNEVREAVRTHACDETTKNDLHAAWEMLESFLDQQAVLPEKLVDIQAAELAAFVKHCRRLGMSEVALPRTLGLLRTLLRYVGHTQGTLSALTAPVRRVRMPNANGKYRYALRFSDDPRCPSNDTPRLHDSFTK